MRNEGDWVMLASKRYKYFGDIIPEHRLYVNAETSVDDNADALIELAFESMRCYQEFADKECNVDYSNYTFDTNYSYWNLKRWAK